MQETLDSFGKLMTMDRKLNRIIAGLGFEEDDGEEKMDS